MIFDVIIIGGGIAGMYSCYRWNQLYPNDHILLVEASDKLGGRMETVSFEEIDIPLGSGIGRERDFLLRKLLYELGIPVKLIEHNFDYSKEMEPCVVKSTFLYLKKMYLTQRKRMTFKDFVMSKLNKKEYYKFLECSGYRDYEEEDALDVFKYYGFEDNYENGNIFYVPWKLLLNRLTKLIQGFTYIQYNHPIQEIRKSTSIFYVDKFKSKKVILATTIEPVRQLLHRFPIYQWIKSQPFLKLYAKCDDEFIPILKEKVPHQLIVKGYLQKIIPVQSDRGIYLIAYNDNEYARLLQHRVENTEKNRTWLGQILSITLQLPKPIKLNKIIGKYWSAGTHYYPPLPYEFKNRQDFIRQAQHPAQNCFVVGEMVSLHQGWVEGALESVEQLWK